MMTTDAPEARTPDTSPAAIAARRREKTYALQDKARALKVQGVKPKAAAEILDIDKGHYDHLAGAAYHRERIREIIASGRATPPELTKPETLLLECIVKVDMGLLARSEVRSAESKIVSWTARKSSGWAVTTARKRLDVRSHAMATESDVPSLGLVRVAGNGYISLTDEGWRVCAELFPDEIHL